MNSIIKIISDTFKSIGTNIPILIVLILGNVGYGFLYNLLYNTNVYRNAPIAVVDMSQSDVSRRFTNYIDATQQVDVVLKTQNYYEAKQKLIENEIIGFVYIPSELKENITTHDNDNDIDIDNDNDNDNDNDVSCPVRGTNRQRIVTERR